LDGHGDGTGGHALEAVLEVVSESLAAAGERVAVRVVGFGVEAVVGIVGEAAGSDAGIVLVCDSRLADRVEA